MKPQDIIFIAILLILLFARKPQLIVIAGLTCLFLSIPLFSSWIFFTAQRLTYYAAAFFVVASILIFIEEPHK
jgi:hypothetical protein